MSLKTDGVPTDAEMDATADRSAKLFFNEVHGLIDEDPDPAGLAYGLFIQLARHLAELNWTDEQLAEDVVWHVNHQVAEGRA